jgi:hypothetical protein
MEILKTIYVALIEGMKSFVPVEAKDLGSDVFLIVSSKLYDPDDDSSLFQFIPGDKVRCKIDLKKDHQGNEEKVFVADSLVSSKIPGRNVQTLKFVIADQNGVLRPSQVEQFSDEIKALKAEIIKRKDNKETPFHPAIVRWAAASS